LERIFREAAKIYISQTYQRTSTAKRARPASQASGQAPARPRRLQAALFVLTEADCGLRRREPAGERRTAASEEFWRKGLKHLTHSHARADDICRLIALNKEKITFLVNYIYM